MNAVLISEKYRAEQEYLHLDHPNHRKYGTGGAGWLPFLEKLIMEKKPETILDYGCGKGFMAELIDNVRLYDPAIVEYSTPPEPADLVMCLDVMEHIEPEFLENVVNDLVKLTRKTLLVAISLKYAARILRDGRNSHLIVKPAEWWQELFERHGMKIIHVEPSRKLEWIAVMEKEI